MSAPGSSSRVAVVTGASRGIGRAVALRLAREDVAVVVGYAESRDQADAVVAEIARGGGRARAVGGDISEPATATALFDAADELGGVDVVVNSAGISTPRLDPVAELDLAVLDRVHAVNVRGTFLVTHEAARRVRPGGAIVTVSSSVLGLGRPGASIYSTSKAAVEALTLILARELRGRDVSVNCVAPGATATELFLSGKDEETVAAIAMQMPLERLGTPEEIAEVIGFLAGSGHWVNGQVIRANGGWC